MNQLYQRKHDNQKINVIIDMETGDPDDLLTLMFAACHPRVILHAVTLTPGSEQQVQLVRHVLATLYSSLYSKQAKKTKQQQRPVVRVGAQEWPKFRKKKGCANLKFYESFLYPPIDDSEHTPGEVERPRGRTKRKKSNKSAEVTHITTPVSSKHIDEIIYPAAELIRDVSQELRGKLTILTGGPLHNLGAALSLEGDEISLERWVAQGGFCGEGVVPDSIPTLPKFEGLSHVQTWNFGGSKEAAMLALQSEKIKRRVLVGKNVCHRCTFDGDMERRLQSRAAGERSNKRDGDDDPGHTAAIKWIYTAISSRYSPKDMNEGGDSMDGARKQKNSKALHDPLALATMLDEDTCSLRQVEVTHVQECGHTLWGSELAEEDSRTFAAVDYDHTRFVNSLLW
eukprot:CAMPEP_0194041244 /NCGR_PEP_ID=MMETSP0009_2-20130614/13149_1 /TAXON_ID=210454 /ORGANISM="Grammatophora oceanica, Strain CCMP 410" /LENGTH=397 /DNA_ID=CAMNT_0038684663 /DNA_START=15 /DNA_END=1205 /DNA_ORIENTATION=+